MTPNTPRPVPLFVDVDGTLIGILASVGATGEPLVAARLQRNRPEDDAFPDKVRFDPAVIAKINELINEGLVQPVWLTTWDDAANRLLAPVFGLSSAPWPVAIIGTRRGDRVQSGIWIKALAAGAWLRDNGFVDDAFVVIDDLLQDRAPGLRSPQRRSMEMVGTGEPLLVGAHSEHGLHVEQVDEIRAFVQAHALAD